MVRLINRRCCELSTAIASSIERLKTRNRAREKLARLKKKKNAVISEYLHYCNFDKFVSLLLIDVQKSYANYRIPKLFADRSCYRFLSIALKSELIEIIQNLDLCFL